MQTDPSRNHPRNTRVISAEELGTMPKNNSRGITLVRGPILGIHSLTLIISWYHPTSGPMQILHFISNSLRVFAGFSLVLFANKYFFNLPLLTL